MDNDDHLRDDIRARAWNEELLPKFRKAGLNAQQIDAANSMFTAGFETGWETHKAHLLKQYIAENQKQKVHLA
jgi:hypothetical protein